MTMTKVTFGMLVFALSFSKSIAAGSLVQSHNPDDYFFPDGHLHSPFFFNESNHRYSRQVPVRDESSLEILFIDDSVDVPDLMVAYKAELLANLMRINARLDFCNVEQRMLDPDGRQRGNRGRGSGTGNFDECIGFGQEPDVIITGFSFDYQTEDRYGMARVRLRTRVEPWLLQIHLFEYAK